MILFNFQIIDLYYYCFFFFPSIFLGLWGNSCFFFLVKDLDDKQIDVATLEPCKEVFPDQSLHYS